MVFLITRTIKQTKTIAPAAKGEAQQKEFGKGAKGTEIGRLTTTATMAGNLTVVRVSEQRISLFQQQKQFSSF